MTKTGGSAQEKTSEIDLTWSYDVVPSRGLIVRYQIKNRTPGDVYVLDRLWTLDRSSQPVVDPEAVYRFERAGVLRLLLGAAPLPRRASVHTRYVPRATHLTANGTREGLITTSAPVREYSVYFGAADSTKLQITPVRRIVLIVQYLVGASDLKVESAPEDPAAVRMVQGVAGLGRTKVVISELPCASLAVWRHSGDFDRVSLPGELPEPFKP